MATVTLPARRAAAPKPRAWEPLKLWRRRVASRIMRARVRTRDFSIISNDCFGGMAYEELGMRYESPFVGLFIVPEDYIRLLRNLRSAMEESITFRDRSQHEHINQFRSEIQCEYPIGVIGENVEIQFLHYPTREQAAEKWQRRAARINWNKLRVKMGWHEQPHMDELLREFDAMPFDSKLIVAPHAIAGTQHCVALRDFSTDGTQQYWRVHKAFDVAAWLDRGEVRRATWGRALDVPLYWHY
ncbi:MAG TPA: DUF1919 domain-containing protein [Candidatus Acidoferrum sp.]|nr:DUF1919 domain-containing protein [Candidatus Acidoferrum sp.]